jgi:hypothetical protein
MKLSDAIKESAAIRRSNEARRLKEAKRQRQIKRVADELVHTLEQGREVWRRYEAMPTTQPTPERTGKALEVAPVLVDRKLVRKVKTTADLLMEGRTPHLPKHLRRALDTFAGAVAEAMGVQVEDAGTGSARMISGYDAMPGGGYGPREISDRILNARFLWKSVERQMPEELMAIAEQMVAEETGLLQGRPASLSQYGAAVGYNDNRQSVAAGTALAYAACSVLAHALKRGLGIPPNPQTTPSRQINASTSTRKTAK